jgi:hypothetical protein
MGRRQKGLAQFGEAFPADKGGHEQAVGFQHTP